MARLLSVAAARGIMPAYAGKLLTAFCGGESASSSPWTRAAAFPPAPVSCVPQNHTPNNTFVSKRRGAEWICLHQQRVTGGISWTRIDDREL
jgi:hypothetical protein